MTDDGRYAYAATVITTAAFLVPEASVVVVAAEVITAIDAASAVVAYAAGDEVPAGQWIVVRFLEERFPEIPWFLGGG